MLKDWYQETVKMELRMIDVSKIGGNWGNRIIYFVGVLFMIYFLWMDIALYFHIQARKLGEKTVVSNDDHRYTPFSDVTVKLIMSDHANHYVYVPTAELFDEATNFSSILSFISPNMISVFHTVVSLLSAKCVSMDSLALRRVGVLLFEFRTWLDALDGVVFRAHAKMKHNFNSVHGTFGYYVDAVADVVAGVALCFAVFCYLKRNLPKKNVEVLPWKALSELTPDTIPSSPVLHVPTKKYIFLKLVWFGILLLVGSAAWDSAIESYHTLLENPTASPKQQMYALEILQSSTTWLILWFWRVSNAHAFLEMVLISVFIDKVWEFLQWIQYLGCILLVTLIIITQIHIHYVKGVMAEFITTQ